MPTVIGGRKSSNLFWYTLNHLLVGMCMEARPLLPTSVLDAVLVGNTAMHHLFAGLPVEQLGHAPFAPACHQAAYHSRRGAGT